MGTLTSFELLNSSITLICTSFINSNKTYG
jgi:hypothetical protein